MQEKQETWAWSLGQEDPLEEEMAAHSSILVWEIPWTEELGGLQSRGWQRVWRALSMHIFNLLNTSNPKSQPLTGLDSLVSSFQGQWRPGRDWEEAGTGETVTIGVIQISQICDLRGGRSPRGQTNMRLLLCYEDGVMDVFFFSKLPWLFLHYDWSQ